MNLPFAVDGKGGIEMQTDKDDLASVCFYPSARDHRLLPLLRNTPQLKPTLNSSPPGFTPESGRGLAASTCARGVKKGEKKKSQVGDKSSPQRLMVASIIHNVWKVVILLVERRNHCIFNLHLLYMEARLGVIPQRQLLCVCVCV